MERPRDRVEWNELLDTLSEQELDIIESYYFFGFTDEDIGKQYNHSRGWANNYRHKTLRKLYVTMGKKGIPPHHDISLALPPHTGCIHYPSGEKARKVGQAGVPLRVPQTQH